MGNHELEHSVDNINPELYGIRLSDKPIDSIESAVYKGTDPQNNSPVALKIYNKDIYHYSDTVTPGITRLTIDDIYFYQLLTEQTGIAINNTQVSFPLISENMYRVEVVPVTRVGVLSSDKNITCLVMPFIPGPQLREDWRDDIWLNEFDIEISDALRKISREAETKVGFEGISLSGINIKRDDTNKILFVTDICSSLGVLKNRPT